MNISRRLPAIVVEYDGRSGRESKQFEDVNAGRRFYTRKYKELKHPKVVAINTKQETK